MSATSPEDPGAASPASGADGSASVLPARRVSTEPSTRAGASRLTRRERDYLLLAILVRVQHLRLDDAAVLAKALAAFDPDDPDALFASAVIAYRQESFAEVRATLARLDRIAPADATADDRAGGRARVRSFMKARATFALTGALDEEARAGLDFYLRRGPPPT